MIEKIIRKYAQSEVVSNMMLKNLAEIGETYGIFEDVDSIKVHNEIKELLTKNITNPGSLKRLIGKETHKAKYAPKAKSESTKERIKKD